MMSGVLYEFAGPEWRAFMHAIIVTRLNQLEDGGRSVDWSFCEVFRDAPESLRTDGTAAAWHCIVKDGEVTFGDSELADPTFKVSADYKAIYPLAKYDTMGDPARGAELAKLSGELMAAGKLSVEGDATKLDARLGSFHDAIAAVTA